MAVVAGGFNYHDSRRSGLLAVYAMEEGGGAALADNTYQQPPAALHNMATALSGWQVRKNKNPEAPPGGAARALASETFGSRTLRRAKHVA